MQKIDDIMPPSSRRTTAKPLIKPANHSEDSEKPRLPYKTLIAVTLVIIISFSALSYFSSAKVDVTPNTVSAAIQNSFAATQGTGDLPFEIISAQKIASQSTKSSGSKVVTSSAEGTITIYNTQSKAQKLITNTRFATAGGLIFRIHQAVTVPAGTTAKPGSVKAKVYADKPGDPYNVGPSSFTIPGFAGTPLEKEVYAKSTDPMTGGASGSMPIVDAATVAQTKAALIAALTPDLMTSLQNQVPSGYTLLPGAATTTFQDLAPAASSSAGMVDIKEQGTITAIVFPTPTLAKAIASSVAGLNYQGEPLSLLPTSTLQLLMTAMPDKDTASLNFTLSGTAAFIYTVDPTRIAAAVAGKTRADAQTALTSYPEVKQAVIILRPFWRQAFPDDPASITTTVANP